MAAREAAQAMVGAAAPAQPKGARGRRMVWGLLAGMALAVLSWLGWQYWMSLPYAPRPQAQPGEKAPQVRVWWPR